MTAVAQSGLQQTAQESQMTQHTHYRLGLALALLCGLTPALVGTPAQQKTPATENFDGKVVPLAAQLEKHGAKLDVDAAEHWMALVTDDGKVFPLIKDDGSRMFFKDKGLLNRPMRLAARQIPGTTMLQVVNVHSINKGQLYDVFYWCDTCSIRCLEPGDCACCGAKVEFREVPVR
jgi:hypothetical protein